MKISSESIKKKAIDLGFEKIGITKAIKTDKENSKLNNWLDNGNHASMEWMEKTRQKRGDIFAYFPEAKSVISVGLNYFSGKSQKDLKSDYKFSNYAWGDDYHKVLKKRLYALLNWIKESKPDTKCIACVDTSPVMDKVWAQKAGLGWIGKHTNLISRDYGSWLFLGELLLDLELDYDSTFDEDLCGSCTACIDACPTQALTEYEIDARKCISYLTIEHRGDFLDDQPDLDGWIYGCDICQEVCPWNQKFEFSTKNNEFHARNEILDNSNEDWKQLNQEVFNKVFKNSAVKRTKHLGLKRNIKKVEDNRTKIC